MANVLKLKSPHCIEWIVNICNCTSESFLLQNVKCNLRFESYGSYEASLYCESNMTLNPSVDMIVIATTKGGNSYGTSNSHFKRTKFTGKRQEIWKHNSGYHIGNSLTLEIFTPMVPISKEIKTGAVSRSNLPQEFRIQSYLENIPHFQALSRDYSKLLDESTSSDVVITCENSKFHAHRIVLGSRSGVLSAMLKSNMVEGMTGVINVEGINKSIFELFLRYLYTAILPDLSIETAKKLYIAADMYAVEELKKACSEYLNKNLSENNACEILVLSDLHSDKDFRTKVISYIVDKKIPQQDKKWSDFCSSHPNLAIEVLNMFIKKHCQNCDCSY